MHNILAVRKAGKFYKKTKMFDVEARVLIGWLSNTLREPANQNACHKVKHFCFYVKVACLSCSEYSMTFEDVLSCDIVIILFNVYYNDIV